MGHLALGAALGQAWVASIGTGTTTKARLASAPVVAGGRVFTIDTNSTVRAFDGATGATVGAPRSDPPGRTSQTIPPLVASSATAWPSPLVA